MTRLKQIFWVCVIFTLSAILGGMLIGCGGNIPPDAAEIAAGESVAHVPDLEVLPRCRGIPDYDRTVAAATDGQTLTDRHATPVLVVLGDDECSLIH